MKTLTAVFLVCAPFAFGCFALGAALKGTCYPIDDAPLTMLFEAYNTGHLRVGALSVANRAYVRLGDTTGTARVKVTRHPRGYAVVMDERHDWPAYIMPSGETVNGHTEGDAFGAEDTLGRYTMTVDHRAGTCSISPHNPSPGEPPSVYPLRTSAPLLK